jgi:hypothetical protein
MRRRTGRSGNQTLPPKIQGKRPEKYTHMTILGLQKLLLILGSKAAVEFRDYRDFLIEEKR